MFFFFCSQGFPCGSAGKESESESENEVAQSCPTLCDPWTVAHQPSPSMGFSRQEYWSGLPFESAYNSGELGSIPGSERSPGEGNGNPLLYSCLENPIDEEAWWATVHGSQRVGPDRVTSLFFF